MGNDIRAIQMEALAIAEELERRRKYNRIARYYPAEGHLSRDRYPKHMEVFRLGARYRERCFQGGNGVGKALRHGTLVATPNGYVAIESLVIGSLVYAGDGSVTHVTGVYPQGEVDLYRLLFDGKREVFACGEHRWVYMHPCARYPTTHSHGITRPNPRFGEWSVGNTRELESLRAECPRRRAVVPMTGAFDCQGGELPLDPYLLGLLLGDGGLSGDSIRFSSADNELVDALRERFDVRYYSRYDYGVNGAMPVVRSLGLAGLTSERKFIPRAYLFASTEDRLALLQGLMDTDGYVSNTGAMEFSTSSDALADGVEWLVASLGMKTSRVRRHTKDQHGNGIPSWRMVIRSTDKCPFRLRRKVERWRPLRETTDWVLHSVTPAGRGEATCISVAHESHTYVIEHGIVTHNTEGVGAYEVALHATGAYPNWWEGRRLDRPADIWVAGDTKETVRDITQSKLIGDVAKVGIDALGTGMLPRSSIVDANGQFTGKFRQGTNYACDFVRVKHVSGGFSTIAFKSYDQRRESFQGTEKDLIWLDEEPPMDIYVECVYRGRTVGGQILLTFTPLSGPTDVVKSFQRSALANEEGASKALVKCRWDDVPHLTDEEKRQMLASCPPYLRDARINGEAVAGTGRIYPVDEKDIVVKPFQLPDYWPRVFGIDCGWHRTAAIWGAHDRDTDIVYLYSEHYKGEAEVPIHAAAIKARGVWIPGVGDAAGGSQTNGERFIELYRDNGVRIRLPNKAVDAGIATVLDRLSTGRLKVFNTCENWIDEYRRYSYDDRQHVRKEDDHLMDATRYLVVSGLDIAARKRPENTLPKIEELRFY